MTLPTADDVRAAATRIGAHIRRTPLFHVHVHDLPLWLKLEHLQVTGSFKPRGATNAVLSLQPVPERVVAASGGNHGLGVAHAAATVGANATVVVPETVPEEKARRLTSLGATIVRHGREYAEAEAHARGLAEQLAAPFIHPFADPAVVAGQGTVAAEIEADLKTAPTAPMCDAVVVAVGGGGLIGGVATFLAGSPLRVVGVEPEGIPTLHAALAAGEPVDVPMESATASALGARRTSPLNLAIAQRHVADVVLVDDPAIFAARDLLWNSCRIAVEPAAAAGLAAVLAGKVEAVAPCIVLCGANSPWRAE